MPRKKKKVERHYPENWTISYEYQVEDSGRHLTPGTELSIVGERGRFTFVKHVKTPTSEWLDVIGGVKNTKMFRSFSIDRVKRVHWKKKLRSK